MQSAASFNFVKSVRSSRPFTLFTPLLALSLLDAHHEDLPAQTVAFYDGVKARVQQALSREGNRQLNIIALTNPVTTDTGTAVWAILQIGIQPLTNYVPGEMLDGEEEIRWAPASEGFTSPTSCSGAADELIGAEVNRRLAIFRPINASPGSGGNTPLPGRIVTRISFGEHNVLGIAFPQGTPYPREYTVATWNTPLQNLHYNSIGFNGNNPPKNCINQEEIDFFIDGNLALAEDGIGRLQPQPPGPFYNRRQVVCTGVGPFWGAGLTPTEPRLSIKLQDHATRHYFGVVVCFVNNPILLSDM